MIKDILLGFLSGVVLTILVMSWLTPETQVIKNPEVELVKSQLDTVKNVMIQWRREELAILQHMDTTVVKK